MIVKMVLQGLAAAAVIAGAGFAWAAATGSPDLSAAVAVIAGADTGYLPLPDGHDDEHGEDRDDD